MITKIESKERTKSEEIKLAESFLRDGSSELVISGKNWAGLVFIIRKRNDLLTFEGEAITLEQYHDIFKNCLDEGLSEVRFKPAEQK